MMLIGAIEAGGTKFVCAVGDETGNILEKVTFKTRGPNETMDDVKLFFSKFSLEGIGIGTFGPISLNCGKDDYGTILNSPKLQWSHYSILERLKDNFNLPIYIDTDVNVAALGEYMYGNPEGVDSILYITVGTGIGAGFVKGGQSLTGKSHPEMGHILIRQHENDSFHGICLHHHNCLEGLASGPAIEKRSGLKGHLLSKNDRIWEFEADYLAQAIMNYTLVLSPDKIVIGGGVMKQSHLYERIRINVKDLLNDYIDIQPLEEYIVAPQLNDEQGVKGALGLFLQNHRI